MADPMESPQPDSAPDPQREREIVEAWLNRRHQPGELGVYGFAAGTSIDHEKIDSRVVERWGAKRRTTPEATRDTLYIDEHADRYGEAMDPLTKPADEVVRMEEVLDLRRLPQGVVMAILQKPDNPPHKRDGSRPEEISQDLWRQEMILGKLDGIAYPRGYGVVPVEADPLTKADPSFVSIHQDVMDARLDGHLGMVEPEAEELYQAMLLTMLLMQRDGRSPRELIQYSELDGGEVIVFDFGMPEDIHEQT